ncbi:MAG: 50S ribosomal protein L18 [Candidatus Yonathbacteria bacterium CG_4_10_14_3_um_filter_47_65]|uniref:Large ribosomal subunit protein uL18 n=2 Tax=Parcubacteria group TaxID=1794811 RepID=A0A2M8D5N1_9BACT|nr:MAG: 50S ribosomal protein L18 [Candidatus Nomurabacteria bacterium CG1_02_47_685]PIP03942.1 MAG: 50S ribosomal protein L18 [Candidatus Yonathbacteria bacterium CG23_combo_of_CG06-09_8_20_14_all_46_18]PIQ32357.1 MAG: 50S ribosomal protein L18 [Candidatus Yonathbacteria bacterium CG17_big_fil_post_rev_8_21_14_2_50_46_19]PIX56294.1 MAG: 50S ribosomal protein L18 [Candidatus Yonathbacteria bacterium CG_4_10_14_3_um_filter_47_65]PIY57917.1 MAG: 50S ribosomal protein L18 [Candidatus Yonathbacteri
MNTRSVKNIKEAKRIRRHGRIRARIFGSSDIPRLSVSRSNNYIFAQLIDDKKGITLVAASDIKEKGGTKMERAIKVGTSLAKEAVSRKISKVVFDRGGNMYTGRVKAFAEGARKGGLIF